MRYAETDMMGLTYHGNYFTWFEVGRVQMMDELGLPYRELEKRGYRLPVLEAHAKFLRPTFFGRPGWTCAVVVRERPTVRLRMDYELFRAGEQCLTGHTVHAFRKPPRRTGEAADRRACTKMRSFLNPAD